MLTKSQLQILQHSLGLDEFGQPPKHGGGRNYFCAGVGDERICRELVALGLMIEHGPTAHLPYYNCSVTAAGRDAIKLESPAPRKLSRSQKRYLRYLDADCDMTFFEWMKAEKQRA